MQSRRPQQIQAGCQYESWRLRVQHFTTSLQDCELSTIARDCDVVIRNNNDSNIRLHVVSINEYNLQWKLFEFTPTDEAFQVSIYFIYSKKLQHLQH